ncbi:MAG: hypothetical protein JWN95_2452 [Frankiales bacterium]|nr:hypothetical protein [Frankiales bacterium]
MKFARTAATVGMLAAVLVLPACTSHSAPAAGHPPASSAHPSGTTAATPVPEDLPVKGVPILIDKKGTGSSDLVVLPHSGPLSIKVSCTATARVTFVLKPDVNATVVCGEGDAVVDWAKIHSTSLPIRIEAKPSTSWTVSVGLGTIV